MNSNDITAEGQVLLAKYALGKGLIESNIESFKGWVGVLDVADAISIISVVRKGE